MLLYSGIHVYYSSNTVSTIHTITLQGMSLWEAVTLKTGGWGKFLMRTAV